MSDFEQYYIHRKGDFVGNAPVWWAKGGNGYTSYILGAERFSRKDAEDLIRRSGEKYKAYRCADVDARLHLVYDVQDDKRLGTDAPCSWSWGYAAKQSMQDEAKFSASDDADRLRSVARGMSYNDMSEATWKHVILEIAMRLDTGGYNPPSASAEIARKDASITELEARKDAAYFERNQCVALIARMALVLGHDVAVTKTAIDGWSEDWHGCVYIELPTGQVSWHFHDSQAYLFEGLPSMPAVWDGHDTPEKYRRVNEAFIDIEQKAEIARLTKELEEARKAINPCGGCGETDPNKRCLGCLHDFHAEQPPCDNDHVAEGCELFTGASDDVA